MKSVFKSVIALMLAAAMLFAFAACSSGNENPNKGNTPNDSSTPINPPNGSSTPVNPPATLDPGAASVSYTIDAKAAYESGMLTSEVSEVLKETGGLIRNKANVTLPKESKTMSYTFRVLEVGGTKFEIADNKVIAIQGVKDGDCGANSRWVLKINDVEVNNANLDALVLNSGDVVVWLYVIG